MAKGSFGFILPIALACVLCLALHAESRMVGEINKAERKTWCIANPFARAAPVERVVSIICKQLNCSVIEPGGDCYEPKTLYNHASVVINLYYRAHHSQRSACYWNHNAVIALEDPSSGKCKYP